MSNRPTKQLRFGNVVLSIWENEKQGGGAYRSVTLQRTYRDGDGNWRYTDSFFENDLLHLAHGAAKAYDACDEIRQTSNIQTAKKASEASDSPADEAPY